MSRTRLPVALLLIAALGGCSATSQYRPRIIAKHELSLAYADGVQIYAGREMLTEAPRFSGLADYVHCVPRAVEHAEDAESAGQAATGLAVAGIVLGAGSLGGLSGLAFVEEDPGKAYAIFGTGIAVALVGMTMALVSRANKNQANGHAVDALNYYNDAVGSRGKRCP